MKAPHLNPGDRVCLLGAEGTVERIDGPFVVVKMDDDGSEVMTVAKYLHMIAEGGNGKDR